MRPSRFALPFLGIVAILSSAGFFAAGEGGTEGADCDRA